MSDSKTSTDGDSGEVATSSPALAIAAIDRGTVHQICSGQVVLNLATAVKELVENSIDAGATSIDIRLRDHGSSSLEVADNGKGVSHENYAGLTLKHHTSKIKEFTDLASVETFGFRGEALSSLCALSKLSISSRHVSAVTGDLILYDHDGNIVSTTPQARPVGTTVTIENIFSTMPVRQKEFLRHIKKEFHKMTQVLYAYCLVSLGVRITCTNTVGRGKKTVVVSTGGSLKLRDNIVSVFGTKQVTGIKEIVQVNPTPEQLQESHIKFSGEIPAIKLSGFISSCVHGEGRNAGDRQFYFINSRPCDPTKIQKVVNEVYHQFNRHQYPFVFLNITSDRTTVDVNITPDKRQVFLQNEKYLCAVVKSTLLATYQHSPATFAVASFPKASETKHGLDQKSCDNGDEEVGGGGGGAISGKLSQMWERKSEKKGTVGNMISSLKRSFSSSFSCEKMPSGKQPKLEKFFASRKSDISPCGDSGENCEFNISMENVKQECEQKTEGDDKESFSEMCNDNSKNVDNESPKVKYNSINPGYKLIFEESLSINEENSNNRDEEELTRTTLPESTESIQEMIRRGVNDNCDDINDECPHEDSNKENIITFNEVNEDDSRVRSVKVRSSDNTKDTGLPQVEIVFEDNDPVENKKICEISFSFDAIKSELKEHKGNVNESNDEKYLKFRAKINPTDNSSAEKELQKSIQKSDFSKMEIFGQFNLGFLIVGLGGDLFIIDQHASDEKYNFETLQQTTELKSQKMVLPQNLELTVVNESILMDNLDVFHKNGFKFEVDESAPPTQKVKLISLPISKNWTFGKEDIDELLFMLQDAPEGTMCRPSRVRSMFASRACRKSVMIGTALNGKEMRSLVEHMGQIEQPWNCPHGRPTMRHLVNTNIIGDP